MAEEFTIKSEQIESKINQLLPSQGGFGAGVDFSASTMVIPIVDLTETAEGSNLRQDLQSSLSLGSVTAYSVSNSTTTLVNTTGYFRVFGTANIYQPTTGSNFTVNFDLTDGTTTKQILLFSQFTGTDPEVIINHYDFIVFLQAGDSLRTTTNSTNAVSVGCTRQIADLQGNLVSPV